MTFAARGSASAFLSVDYHKPTWGSTMTDTSGVEDQFSAVINIHGSNLAQIEAAIASNSHSLDPHPNEPGKSVRRHPVYLVAEDYSNLDAEGRPAPGAPAELDLVTIRSIFTARPEYAEFIANEDPPKDGSHIRMAGMYSVAELDQAGNPTGRVIFGNSPEVAP